MKKINVEGRVLIFGVTLLTLSTYISGFNYFISILVILISFFGVKFNVRIKQFFFCLIAVTPFTLISFLAAPFNYSLTMSFAMLSILFAGTLPLNLTTSEFCCALSYFIPEKYSFQIALAIRMFSILKKDLKHCFEGSKLEGAKGVSVYKNALKAFVSISVLRSVAVAETLYCRKYSERVFKDFEEVSTKSKIFLTLCLFTFVASIFLRFNT